MVLTTGAGHWLAEMNGDTYHKNGSFHGIELATLDDPPIPCTGDECCNRVSRPDMIIS